jgi:hypothetical protein
MVAAATTVEFVAVVLMSSRFVPWSAALNLSMFLCLSLYGMFLGRLSGKTIREIAPPFLILACVLVIAESPIGFIVPAAAVLAWVRSGICFSGTVFRRTVSEAATVPAGLALIAVLHPTGLTGWAMGVWMFFLFQALYLLSIDPDEIRTKPDSVPDREAATLRGRAVELRREQRLERLFATLELSSHGDSDRKKA